MRADCPRGMPGGEENTVSVSPRAAAQGALAVGALGVVFGDIGTSPLYTVQTVFNPGDPHPVKVTEDSIFGIISLIFWAVTIIVTITYVLLVMRADNDGEGGIMALIALIRRRGVPGGRRAKAVLAALGLFGASLFFGDSMITPAISVLSAIEGVKVSAPSLSDLVIPITVAIIVALFLVQHLGTGAVGRLFGPVMAIWFAAIGVLGVRGIAAHPAILKALSPTYALGFLFSHFGTAFFSLAAVVLAVTGAEALYADMGHFGRAPITRVWLILVFPACILNYMGLGALILGHPASISSPFFLLAPGWARLPMVFLAAVATVIASQAVITGAFSVASHGLARLPSAAAHRVYLGRADRPDLRPVDQLAAPGHRPHARRHVQELSRAGLRVRRGRDRHDHDHDPAVLLRRPLPVAQTMVDRRARRRHPPHRGPPVLRRQPDQAAPRSMASAADRHRRVHRLYHLAEGPRTGHPSA